MLTLVDFTTHILQWWFYVTSKRRSKIRDWQDREPILIKNVYNHAYFFDLTVSIGYLICILIVFVF